MHTITAPGALEKAGSYLLRVVALVAQREYLCLPEVLPNLVEFSLKANVEHEFFELLRLSIGLQVLEEDNFRHFEDESLLLAVLAAEKEGQFHYIMCPLLN